MALYYLLNYLVISASRRIDQICTQQLCISPQYSQGIANHAKLPSHLIRACNIFSQYKTSYYHISGRHHWPTCRPWSVTHTLRSGMPFPWTLVTRESDFLHQPKLTKEVNHVQSEDVELDTVFELSLGPAVSSLWSSFLLLIFSVISLVFSFC